MDKKSSFGVGVLLLFLQLVTLAVAIAVIWFTYHHPTEALAVVGITAFIIGTIYVNRRFVGPALGWDKIPEGDDAW